MEHRMTPDEETQWNAWRTPLEQKWDENWTELRDALPWLGLQKPAVATEADTAVWGVWVGDGDEGTTTTAWIGVEWDAYLHDEPAKGAQRVVSLDFNIPLPKGVSRAVAIHRVSAALKTLRGIETVDYPYKRNSAAAGAFVRPDGCPTGLVLQAKGNIYLKGAVWLSFRLATTDGKRKPHEVVAQAFKRLRPHAKQIGSIVHEALGAIQRWEGALSRDAVTGWAGEVLARSRLGPGYEFGEWNAAYDLRSGAEWVEVKATTMESEGELHWSANELQLARTHRKNYRLVCCRVPSDLVDDLTDALRAVKQSKRPVVPTPRSVDVQRLAGALQGDARLVDAVRPQIDRAIHELQRLTVPVRQLRDPVTVLNLPDVVREATLDFVGVIEKSTPLA